MPKYQQRFLARIRSRRFVGARYFLRTDINQFYPSIYTHSIPWAMHGKAHAKANIGRTQGDLIDRALRNQQDGQTVGVPIGPDTSLVIAEVVLATIDAALAHRNLRGLRYVDDYELSFRTLASAEAVLNELQGLLSEFELFLNPRKTSIVEGPIPFDETWVVDLRGFPFRRAGPAIELNDAIAFFNRAFELAVAHPQQAVLRYASVVAQRWQFGVAGWRTFHSLLLNVATADPGTLPAVIVLLERHLNAGRTLGTDSILNLIESIVSRHAPLGHGSEVAWALWMAIQFEINLSADTAEKVAQMEDDIVALLSLDIASRGLFPLNGLDHATWRRLVDLPNALNEEHWLLAYEANRQGWLPNVQVAAHPFFSVLEANRVSFYDQAARLVDHAGAAAAAPGGALTLGYW